MTDEAFELLALAYLHGELTPQDRASLQQRIAAEPATLARILELADEELLLVKGLKTPRVSVRVSRRSKRMSQRRSVRRKNVRSAWPVGSIGIGIAALLAIGILVFSPWQPHAPLPAVAVLDGSSPDSVLIHAGQATRAKAGLPLCAQDRLTTRDGVATVRYPDGTLVQLSASSELQLEGSAADKQLRLLSGTLLCKAAKQSATAPLIMHTREADSRIIGTLFKLSSTAGSTTLQVDEGAVQFTALSTHESTQVHAGESAVADAQGKLALSKHDEAEEPVGPDFVSVDFPNESAFGLGTLDRQDVPPGASTSVREVMNPSMDKLSIMQSKFMGEKPFVVIYDDSVIHLQYRSEITGGFSEFELFLLLFPAKGWSSECNVICRVKPPTTNWETVDLPIAKFLPVTDAPGKLDGMVCRAFFVQNYDYTGIRVAKFWVTRGAGSK